MFGGSAPRRAPDSVHVHHVAFTIDAEFLVQSAHAAHEHGMPLLTELGTVCGAGFTHRQFAVVVLLAPHSRMSARNALGALTSNGHQL